MLTRKPRIGDVLQFPNGKRVTVHHFGDGHRDSICYYAIEGHDGPREGTDCFIWRFNDGLNSEVINMNELQATAAIETLIEKGWTADDIAKSL